MACTPARTRSCVRVLTHESGLVEACTTIALPDSDFCESCAAEATQEGETDSLRCPWCDEYGDFTHLVETPVVDLVDPIGPPGAEVECGSCHLTSYVLEARLWLRIQRTLLPEEAAR